MILGVNRIMNSNQQKKELIKLNSNLNQIHIQNQNLIKTENNVRELEGYFCDYEKPIYFVDSNGLIIDYAKFLGKNTPCLIFCFHENSCAACIQTQIENLKELSSSIPIQVILCCKTTSSRFLNLIKRNNEIVLNSYRLTINDEFFNDELLTFPFYFLISENAIGKFYIPLKEFPERDVNYFDYIKSHY
jgi:hypothetical protein